MRNIYAQSLGESCKLFGECAGFIAVGLVLCVKCANATLPCLTARKR